jgi:hypothetical protein
MKPFFSIGLLLLFAIGIARSMAAAEPDKSGKSGKPTAEEIGKQWGFDDFGFGESGQFSSASESSEKLK